MKIIKIDCKETRFRFPVYNGGFDNLVGLTERTVELEDVQINGAPCKVGYDAEFDVLVIGEVEQDDTQETKRGILIAKILNALRQKYPAFDWRVEFDEDNFYIIAILTVQPLRGKLQTFTIQSIETYAEWFLDFDCEIDKHFDFVYRELKSKLIK